MNYEAVHCHIHHPVFISLVYIYAHTHYFLHVRLLERRHAEQLKELSEQLGSDREQFAVQNLSLEKQVSSLQEEESRLRIQVTTLQLVSIVSLLWFHCTMKFSEELRNKYMITENCLIYAVSRWLMAGVIRMLFVSFPQFCFTFELLNAGR
jgi:hypothetical protein